MSKQIVSSYLYSPTTNVVTLSGVTIDTDQLLIISAPQVSRTLYNFATGPTAGVAVSGSNTIITLNASTAGLTTTSGLIIYYDDQANSVTANISNSVTIGSLPAISGTVTANTFTNLDYIYVGGLFTYTDGGDTTPYLYLNTYFKRTSETIWESWSYPTGEDKCTARIYNDQANDQAFWKLDVNYSGFGGPIGTVIGTLATIALDSPNLYAKFPPQTGWAINTGDGFSGDVLVSYNQPSVQPITGTVTANLSRPTWTDYSGTIVTAGTAVTAVSTITRSYLLAQVTTGQMFLNIGATATTLNGVYFSAGQGFAWETSVPQGIVSVISTVTGTNYVLKNG